MADPLWMELRQFAQQIAWPTAMAADPESRVVYEAGLDMVNSYSGDPAVLVKALRQFGQCRSAAYANAGIAAVLMIGSYFTRGYLRPKRLAGSRTVLAESTRGGSRSSRDQFSKCQT